MAFALTFGGLLLGGCSPSLADCRGATGAQNVEVRYENPSGSTGPPESVDLLRDRVERRLRAEPANRFTDDCPTNVTKNANGVVVFLPKGSPDARFQLRQGDSLQFRLVLAALKAPPAEDPSGLSNDLQYLVDADGTTYLVGPNLIPSNPVETAKSELDPQSGRFQVVLSLTPQGSKDFDAMAAASLDRQIALVLEGRIVSAPTINSARFNGTVNISGNFTEAETVALAKAFTAEAFPAPLEITDIDRP